MEKLDIGCGEHCLADAIGIDRKKIKGVKYAHDLNKKPWPVKEKFSYIRCRHVIEHIENLTLLAEEIYRLAKPDCVVEFFTPHFSSWLSWTDPTHRHHFSSESIPMLFQQTLGSEKFAVIHKSIRFTGSFWDFPGWLIYKLSPKKYEKHFAWVFPANEIRVTLKILK